MQPYHFPSYKAFNPHEKRKLKNLRACLRFYGFSLLARQEIKQFEAFLTLHPMWRTLFEQNPYRCDALLRKFCDNRWNASARLAHIQQNFLQAERLWGVDFCQRLVQEERILLAECAENYCVYLTINQIDPFEGFFALSLQTKDGTRIYDSSFTLLTPNQLLIASLQGSNEKDAAQLMKATTKGLFGVRPMFMMTQIFRFFCENSDLLLCGIAHKNQCKYRFNDSSRLLFNYDEFWQENGAEKNEQGYWQIPLTDNRKPLEDIASKKRAMYRKRYAMLDDCREQIRAVMPSAQRTAETIR